MKIHNVVQGSEEWLALRTKHHTASEAAAMMGADKRASRNDLLRMKTTGSEKEFSDWVQRNLLNSGHAAEEAARPLVEEMLGEALYPVTATDDAGYLLASFDGLTMDESTGFEHKLYSEPLAAQVRARELEPHYWWQLEQQILVGGLDRIIFVCSDGTRERFEWMEYRAVPGRAEQLIAGWRQFDEDLASYAPPEVIPAVMAAPQMALPAVTVQVQGSIAIRDNLTAFGDALTGYVERINRQPQTDQDFADLEATVKVLKEAEERLEAAERGALAQTESIDLMRRTVAQYRDIARSNRLLVEKLVKAEKENRRAAIVQKAKDTLAERVAKINERIGRPYMPVIAADFAGKIKGLKTLASIQNAVDTELARATIEANEIADRIQINLNDFRAYCGETDYRFLFPDFGQLVGKAAEDFSAIVANRIDEHKRKEAARLEVERERIRQEEEARAAARLKTEQEEVARQQREREEAEARALAAAQANVAPAPQPVAPAQAIQDTGKTLKLGEINAQLAPLSISAEGLAQLGFHPVGKERAAVLYRQGDFPAICAAIARHAEAVGRQQHREAA